MEEHKDHYTPIYPQKNNILFNAQKQPKTNPRQTFFTSSSQPQLIHNFNHKQSPQENSKHLYKKDFQVPQPINIMPNDHVKCLVCKEYYYYPDAIHHIHPGQCKNVEQPVLTPNCECSWACCQENVQVQQPIQKTINPEIPKFNKRIGLSQNESFDIQSKFNRFDRLQPDKEQPLYEKIVLNSSLIQGKSKKPVFFKRELELEVIPQQSHRGYNQRIKGGIGPMENNHGQFNYKMNLQGNNLQNNKIGPAPLTDSGYSNDCQNAFNCGNPSTCCTPFNCDDQRISVKKNPTKKPTNQNTNFYVPQLKPNQNRVQVTSVQDGLNPYQKIQNYQNIQQQNMMNDNLIQSVYQNDTNNGCQCKFSVNMCGGYVKFQTLTQIGKSSQYYDPNDNNYKPNSPFYQNNKASFRFPDQRGMDHQYHNNGHNCPLCGINNACSYCNNQISPKMRLAMEQTRNLPSEMIQRIKDMNNEQQQWQQIWKFHRPWQKSFDYQSFEKCRRDAKAKHISKWTEWQDYVICQLKKIQEE